MQDYEKSFLTVNIISCGLYKPPGIQEEFESILIDLSKELRSKSSFCPPGYVKTIIM